MPRADRPKCWSSIASSGQRQTEGGSKDPQLRTIRCPKAQGRQASPCGTFVGRVAAIPPRIVNVEDFRRAARARLPRIVFDYLDGGADDEITLRGNCRVFGDVVFRPRYGLDLSVVDMSTTLLGQRIPFPFILAPIGSSRMFWPRAEAEAAAAAGKAGTIYTLSTLSGTRLEEVKAATTGPCWYQLYLCGGRDVASAAIDRAAKAGYSALMVTIDTPVAGNRERDPRNGTRELISGHPLKMLPHVPQLLTHPRWLYGFLSDGGLMQFPNVMLPDGPMKYADVAAALESAAVQWKDLAWIRTLWRGPIVVKGVHGAEDVERALDAGVDALVVSNHGGRQLDCVAPTLRVLPEVLDAAGGRVEVLVDGGIRRGSDIAKALALGARAVLLGRAYAFGLAADGERGVTRAIEILSNELRRTMKLLGCASVQELDRRRVEVPASWSRT
jgi:isopentenyl diphosphate isomerase/L-lactate dehydrogenase-like FMN-dependent dehydrogenase